jgi:hypothetical protein
MVDVVHPTRAMELQAKTDAVITKGLKASESILALQLAEAKAQSVQQEGENAMALQKEQDEQTKQALLEKQEAERLQ